MLIILDIVQEIDGRDLLRELKGDALTKDIEVFVLTASDDPLVRRVCFELGASDCFVKPSDGRFLSKVVKRVAKALLRPSPALR